MASRVEQAFASRQLTGATRLRGGARSEVKAATIETPGVNSALSDSLQRFAQTGMGIAKAFDDKAKSLADERSNEIIRKLTPEQRRQAITNGTLLYQDDPYAMEALKQKTGRNAAYLVDDEVSQKIKNGEFRTRMEMEEYRHTRLQQAAQSYAEDAGINPVDEHYQKGFNSDITDRNIALYGQHDVFLSQQQKSTAMMANRVDVNSLLNDEGMMRSPQAGKALISYFRAGMQDNSIPSDGMAMELMQDTVRQLTSKPGGMYALQGLENERLTLNGKDVSVRELVGDDVWQNAVQTAQGNEYQLDAKKQESLSVGLTSALYQDDPTTALAMVTKLEEANNLEQPGEEMTPQRQQIIETKNQILHRIKMDTDAKSKELVKTAQRDQRQIVIDRQYDARLKGDNVSTNFSDMPVNETTGEFKKSDMTTFAANKLRQIDMMGVPDAVKDKRKLEYLKGDSADGPFRTAFQTMTGDAAAEWQGAVIRGEFSEDNMKRFNELRRVYQANPVLMSQLYPDQAALFQTFADMDTLGLPPQTLIEADRSASLRTKEQRIDDDKAWDALHNDSTNKELAWVPASLDAAARKVYDSAKGRSGNEKYALDQTAKWINEQTTLFTDGDVEGKTVGRIPKNMLMVTDDVDSAQVGADIINAARTKLQEVNPAAGRLTVTAEGNSIYLTSANGLVRVRYDQDVMRRMYQQQTDATSEKKYAEAEKKANTRAVGTILKSDANKRKAKQEEDLQKKGGLYGDVSLQGMVDVLTGDK